MSSTYNGSGSTIYTSSELMTGGDRPSAQALRTPFERIFDSLAALSAGVDAKAIKVTGGTFTLENHLTIAPGTGPYQWRWSGVSSFLSGSALNLASGSTVNVQNGATLDVDGTLDIGGVSFVRTGVTFTIRTGATLVLEDDSVVTLAGDMTVTSAGNIFVADDGLVQFEDGSVLNLQSGATQNVLSGASIAVASGGTLALKRAKDVTIDNESFDWRCAMVPASIAESTPGTGDWAPEPGRITYLMSAVGEPSGWIVYPLKFREGDTITTAVVRLEGGAGIGHGALPAGAPADMPLCELVSYDNNGDVTSIRQVTDGATASYDSPHDVTISGGLLPYVVGANETIAVRVLVEGGARAVAGTTRLCSIRGTGLRASVIGTDTTEVI